MTTIEALQSKQIIAIENGDIAERDALQGQIEALRFKASRAEDFDALAGEVEKRNAHRRRAERIIEKATLQGQAIDEFIDKAKEIESALNALMPTARELVSLNNKTWEQYVTPTQLSAQNPLPQGYLPHDFKAPTLGMKGGQASAVDVGANLYKALNYARGMCLAVERVDLPVFIRPAEGFENLGDAEIPGGTDAEGGIKTAKCIVCQSEHKEAIDRWLADGETTLRQMESRTGISKASISRHAKHGAEDAGK